MIGIITNFNENATSMTSTTVEDGSESNIIISVDAQVYVKSEEVGSENLFLTDDIKDIYKE